MPLLEVDLVALASAKVEDARVLLAGGRPDSAAYVCGYAVELALKASICRTLGWAGYPSTRNEFDGYQSFKTHSLKVLLRLSGREAFVQATLPAEWLVVAGWDPEIRYRPVGHRTTDDARAMIDAADAIVRTL